jgi:hypothetical protein
MSYDPPDPPEEPQPTDEEAAVMASGLCGVCGEENNQEGCYACSECDDKLCPCCGRYVMVIAGEIYCGDGCKLKWHSWGSIHIGDGCCDEFKNYRERDKGAEARRKDEEEKKAA